ncbi:asparagine synthase (glutamine-hydrolyzing) [Pandoraea eparura]|uniref:asparagine synthase (glutamine-hydrolyzing) n=1 Tax=Pandoraea eparura TaxID=2508291 RepID=A0A5E4WAX8_9BURK|nr:asparagine synthase (glutamine-hydrolyzing) [Pandoraea eparura]VVE20255.1 asparagine synthase (glutamine-hydrolyzing) [Pandoraea eparura]
MCGIAGIISRTHGDADLVRLEQMLASVFHRGPDGGAAESFGKVAFGHRRLAILDLSDEGKQPMHSMDDAFVLTYNGEVYNYVELREELMSLGFRFHSTSDSEVILAAYQAWGADCVNRFNGMWAFAILDRARRKVFCSRDRFGVKPFYYVEDDRAFMFGSEIRQLIGDAKPRANERVVLDFIVTSFSDHDEDTFFLGVRKLPAGCNLTYDLATDDYVIERYYTIPKRPEWQAKSAEEASREYTSLLDDAVKLRLRSDVPVGTCLSGGLDSSSVATLAATRYKSNGAADRFVGITAVSESARSDESAFAKDVVERADLEWVSLRPTYEDFVATLPEVVKAQEEPYAGPSINMQWFVMRAARAHGLTVLLDGQGGDETLLGYEKYYAAHVATVWRERGPLAAWRAVTQARRNNAKLGFVNMAKFIVGGLSAPARYAFYRWRHGYVRKLPSQPAHLTEYAKACLDEFKLQSLEMTTTNLPILLRYEDKNSMAHSIETRLPFLDYRAVEAALSIRAEHKIRGGWSKWVLRRGMADRLPESVAWRKNKFGFEAPEDLWLPRHAPHMLDAIKRSPLLARLCEPTKLEAAFAGMDLRSRWRLYSVALWEDAFGVSV